MTLRRKNKNNTVDKGLNRDYFFCYNRNVANYLKGEGIGFITVAKDLRTNKIFTLYPKSDELQKALDKYSNTK